MAIPRSSDSPSQAAKAAPANAGPPASGGKKIFRELFGLSLLFWGLFVLLTLITYSSQDPGINHVVSAAVGIKNSGGMFGAHVSGLLVDLFGFAAFVWPLVFLAWGAGCVSTWFTMPWWRWFGFIMLGACFVSLGSATSFGVGDVRGGGMLGASLYSWGQLQFSPAGSGLAWLFMLFISLELAFGIQWMNLLQRGYGVAKETAEANDITLARIVDTVKRYTPLRKNDEPVIALLDITVDDSSVQPPPLNYAETVGAALYQEATEAARAHEAAVAAGLAHEAAVVAGLAQEAAIANARLEQARMAQASQLQATHGAAQSVLTAFAGAQPVNLQSGSAEPARNSASSVPVTSTLSMPVTPTLSTPVTPTLSTPVTPTLSTPVTPSSPLPEGFLGQARPVDLRSPASVAPRGGARVKKGESSKLADMAGGLFGSLRGLFKRGDSSTDEQRPATLPEPTINLLSVVPDPATQPVASVPVSMHMPPQPAPAQVAQVVPAAPAAQVAPAAPAAQVAPAVPVAPQAEPAAQCPPILHLPLPSPRPLVLRDPSRPLVDPFAGLTGAPPVPPVAQPQPVPHFVQAEQFAQSAPVAEAVARPVALEPATPPWAVNDKLSLPPLSLLQTATDSDRLPDTDLMAAKGEQLMACLGNFTIRAELVRITPGPVVTLFEIRPAPGTKVARIINLHQDIALALRAIAVRIHTIPGEDTLGIEIPNESRATVNFRRILESDTFQNAESPLTLALGANIGGGPVCADLAKMPHLLVGGATGSGKSVCINTLLLSLLYKAGPDDLKLLMVDPKVVELAMYADLPHLIHPVVTETALAKNALDWAVHEMEERYNKLARAGVRNIAGYNQKIHSDTLPPELADLEPMPYLVIVVDELSDLMLSAGKDVETAIVRLAQLARACGIHLIIATQRPSVDVVTGLIKANFPSRIAFQVTSAHDSRTILDSIGAELLLGKGDMLFKPSGSKPRRLHGPFASDEDVQAVVDYWKSQRAPDYALDFSEWGAPPADARVAASDASGMSDEEAMYGEIVQFAMEEGKKLSISKLQRRFRIGFNKAARFMERMQQEGIIQPAGHANRSRDVVN